MSQPHTTATLVSRLRDLAQSHDGEAALLDNEFPEPDEYCQARGGDSARSTAALLREAADTLEAREQELGELNAIRELCARRPALDGPTLYANVAKALAFAKRTDEAELRAMAAEAALTEARQQVDAEWSCSTCGAHFVKTCPSHYYEGVTRCTRCVEVEVLSARLAALTAENNRLLTVLREVSEYLDGSNYATDSGDLPDTVRAALAVGSEAK